MSFRQGLKSIASRFPALSLSLVQSFLQPNMRAASIIRFMVEETKTQKNWVVFLKLFFFTRIGVYCWLWKSWTLESIYSESRHRLAQILKTLKTFLLLFFLIEPSWHSPNCEYIWRLSEQGDNLHTEFIYDEENENRLEWKERQIPSNMMTHNTSATIQKEDCPSNLAT